jgi:uncharacterized DUF497 family protein
MEITFHGQKRDDTLKLRGLDFADAALLFSGFTLTVLDDRFAYGEDRFQTIGQIKDDVIMVVWTPRGDARHVISMRKCSGREREKYHDQRARFG